MSDLESYNSRLFDGNNIRSYLHNGRFNWFKKQMDRLALSQYDLVELGCFDGKLLDFCTPQPDRYLGLDADWEGGLIAAKEKFAKHPRWKFEKALDASALHGEADNSFKIGAAMETLEHIPVEILDDYLAEMARVIDGYFFVTVPNEKGVTFLAKYSIKRFILRSVQDYKGSEIWNAFLGRMNKVERNEHKGFDYDALATQIGKYFDIVSVGSANDFLPKKLAMTIGIVAKSKV